DYNVALSTNERFYFCLRENNSREVSGRGCKGKRAPKEEEKEIRSAAAAKEEEKEMRSAAAAKEEEKEIRSAPAAKEEESKSGDENNGLNNIRDFEDQNPFLPFSAFLGLTPQSPICHHHRKICHHYV
ncbi:hypothetical protein CISIN_1g0378901mg, partial [Citrus sinensis]